MSLADKDCVPASPGTPPLSRAAMEPMLEELGMGWAVNQAGHLKCLYQFPDFKAALGFANKVGALAEEAPSSARMGVACPGPSGNRQTGG